MSSRVHLRLPLIRSHFPVLRIPFSIDIIFLVLVLPTLRARAPTPLPAALPATSPSRLPFTRRRTHESEVDTDRLFEQLLAVCAFDRGFRVGERRVFDQDVALPTSHVSMDCPCPIYGPIQRD